MFPDEEGMTSRTVMDIFFEIDSRFTSARMIVSMC